MKLKMADGSLFAILLRSPWWLSFVIAAVLGAAAVALLPADYRVVGVVSTLPFVVIGCIAAWRQWQVPSAARVARTQQLIGAMNWAEFSSALEEAFRRDGYTVRRGTLPAVDFELERGDRRVVVSARRWKSARTGVEPLRELQSARETLDAHDAVYVVQGGLTEQALPFISRHRIQVWQAMELTRVLHGVQGFTRATAR